MIYIDDAGWGCLISGVLVGVYREETKEFIFEEVPVRYFQGIAFTEKVYLTAAGEMTINLLDYLKVSHTEEIKICTGYCLDGIAEMLSKTGYNFTRGKITGDLQDKIEHALLTVLECKYDFKVTYEELTEVSKKGLFWWKQIAWLKDGNVNRHGCNPSKTLQCKTGWATFDAWAKFPYQEAKIRAAQIRNNNKRFKGNYNV